MRRPKRASKPMHVLGTTNAMSRAINRGGRGQRIATELGEALIRQFQGKSVGDANFYFQLALAYQLRGRRYERRAAEARAAATECPNYTPKLAEDFDRDEFLDLIRGGPRRRDRARAWELYNQPWPQHRQSANRQAVLLAVRARFMYALRRLQESLDHWL